LPPVRRFLARALPACRFCSLLLTFTAMVVGTPIRAPPQPPHFSVFYHCYPSDALPSPHSQLSTLERVERRAEAPGWD